MEHSGNINKLAHSQYRGRFAPSPTGDLHLGSLVAAVASYLDAKAHYGRWLIRIEDIDQARCHEKYAISIIQALEAHGLISDEPIEKQSEHLEKYQFALNQLKKHVYHCDCTRQQSRESASLGALGYIYPRYCFEKQKEYIQQPSNIRLYLNDQTMVFEDRIQGFCRYHLNNQIGDPILKRKNNEFAYALAVVVDDARQGINNIVRGADLLAATSLQMYLQKYLSYPSIYYAHVPLVLDENNHKLSKQNHAQPICSDRASENLVKVLSFLNQDIREISAFDSVTNILEYATIHWDVKKINNK